MPMWALFSAGASFTPSPVTATTCFFCFSASTIRRFWSAPHAGEDDLGRIQRQPQLDVVTARASSSPVSTSGASDSTSPTSRAIARAVRG